jgi:hypothetical protein
MEDFSRATRMQAKIVDWNIPNTKQERSWKLPPGGMYKGESVNGPQISIERRTCDIWTWIENIFSRHILHQHWYNCPIALPFHLNPQHRNILAALSATSAPPFQPLHHQRKVCHQIVNCFTRQTPSTANRIYFLLIFFALSHFAKKNAALR